MDQLVEVLRYRRGVIVDLRHNPGGDFQHGFALAGRFADARRWFEGRGLPPDVRVDNTPENVASGVDPQLERARKILANELGADDSAWGRRTSIPEVRSRIGS